MLTVFGYNGRYQIMFLGQAAVAASVHPGIKVAQVSKQQPQQITMPTPVQGVRPIGNTVRVRASTSAGAAATPTAGGGQQIKVVGATGQTHTIIKSAPAAAGQPGGITGIAALAAAAAQQGKMVTSMTGGVAGGQAIKVVQGAQPGIKVAQANLGQTAVIGGQIRLASPGKLAIEFKRIHSDITI